MKKVALVLAFLLVSLNCSAQGLLAGLLGGISSSAPSIKFIEGDSNAQEELLLIKLHGTIQEVTEDDEGLMSIRKPKNMIESIKATLALAQERTAVKAVFLEINSPGGEVTGADLIYHHLKKFTKDSGKPVYAHITNMGASGGYYIACGCSKIYCLPTSMIGSIGVIMQAMNVEELANKLGLKLTTLKSEKTPYKDLLSPFKATSEEEKAILMEIINDIYNRFVSIVAENRKLSKEAVEKCATGAIYTAEKCLKLGLIDGIGYREEIVGQICKDLNLKSIAVVIKEDNSSPFAKLFEGMSSHSNDIRPVVESFIKQLSLGTTPVLMFR